MALMATRQSPTRKVATLIELQLSTKRKPNVEINNNEAMKKKNGSRNSRNGTDSITANQIAVAKE
jgi:hypothetical protein